MRGCGAGEDCRFRQMTVPLEAGLVLGVLAEGLGVDVKDFCRRRSGSYLRSVAAGDVCGRDLRSFGG